MAKVLGGATGGSVDLYTLSMNLRQNARIKPGQVRRVVKDNAQQTVKNWKELHRALEVHRHAKHLPKAISWDFTSRAGASIGAEIGPDKGRKQGALGNLVEFGSKNNTGWKNIDRAINWQEPKFVADMRRVATIDI